MATIYDVARVAGVSPQTVSRVLNGTAPVKKATRALIEAAISELQYIPSNAARTMRSQKSGLVGLISASISSSSREPAGLPSTFIVQGVQQVVAANGKTLLIADTGGEVEQIPALVQTLLEHRVEGLLYVAEFHKSVELPPIARAQPLVLANCFDGHATPSVVPDNAAGGFELVKALIAAGHIRIGFLMGPEANISTHLRLEGYKRAHADAGVPFDPTLVVTAAHPDREHEFELLPGALESLLALPQRPTVLCTHNDKMAMRLYGLLRERRLDIPSDISVAGYDDYRLISEQLHPPLTSVNLSYGEIGRRAAAKLLHVIESGVLLPEEQPEKVSGPLAWRESTTSLAQRMAG